MPPIPNVQNEEMIDAATLVLKAVNVRERLGDLLLQNAPKVRQCLYVQLYPQLPANELLSVLPVVYENAAKHCPQLDVRLLLGITKPHLTNFIDDDLNGKDLKMQSTGLTGKKYDCVVLGGTFDRFHYGHKLLLSTSILLANKYIVCGVTDKDMNKKKTLWEFIQPVEERIANVKDFIQDVSSGVELRAEPIFDPFGPSIIDAQLQCIVVSKETFKGGEAVNRKRQERGLSTLEIFEIGLLGGLDEKTKLSSSAARRNFMSFNTEPQKGENERMGDDEYEEVIVIADLKGVVNPSTVHRALLRFEDTGKPVVQIGSSMFTGEWNKTVGTDLLYKSANAPHAFNNSDDLLSCSTRLTATAVRRNLMSSNTEPQKGENKRMDDDEYEEVIVVADLKGVLDPSTVPRALNQNNVSLRFANTEKPVVQIGSSMFTGEWNKTLGTDLLYKSANASHAFNSSDKSYDFLSCSSTRLTATKAIVSKPK
ncbi:Bifunctional coenzyme A synthase [Aphelenchoides bicaudatus]|nr:Bifunctional coenzyme A synthase [Aphelenchoides bicaudatus]